MEDDGSPLNNFGKGLKKLFGKSRRGSGEDLTEQEIMSMVNEGHEHGVLQERSENDQQHFYAGSERSKRYYDSPETDHGTGWTGDAAGGAGADS